MVIYCGTNIDITLKGTKTQGKALEAVKALDERVVKTEKSR
jgi:hypothetical protein